MKLWSKCPKKQQARNATIVSAYRQHFGHSIDGQYWSMAGRCDGPGCEYDQVVSEGLVSPKQFHGVDHDRSIVAGNKIKYPEAHWHHADFYRAMMKAEGRRVFNPSIVNADLLQTADNDGAEFVGRIMGLLSPYRAMLVANFIIAMPHRGYNRDADYVIDNLENTGGFQWAARQGWTYLNCYEYAGTNRASTKMASFIFARKKLAVAA